MAPSDILPTSNKFVDIDMALDVVFIESVLQQFVVLNEFIIRLCLPIDLGHGNRIGEHHVKDLTSNSCKKTKKKIRVSS